MDELVVLVDEQNNVVGTAPKETVHTKNTPLHRAFSLFLFNFKKEVLLTKRAEDKKTFPGVWTNAVCGHPGSGESEVDAAKRRLKDELGISGSDLKSPQGLTLVSDYRYRFTDKNGIVENEICPIIVGYTDENSKPNPNEVADWKWMDWKKFLEEIKKTPNPYSPWCIEEAFILQKKNIV